MKCPKCDFENPVGMQFCGKCGDKLALVCPKCHFANSPEFVFCGKCGAPLIKGEGRRAEGGIMVPPKLEEMQSRLYIPLPLKEKMQIAAKQLEGENRLVTVMFADISGFTPASENLSPEQVAELASECFKAIVDSIVRYEGYINRFIGDSVLAFFGAPISHENDPERAILAALDIIQSMQKLNRQVTIGINTGMVYLGPVGADIHQEYTVEGHAVNLAKRLQEAAKPGQIIVGEGTYRLTRRAFEFEPLPPLTLKGISKPVLAYKALKALPKPEKLRGLEGLKAPLIGRDEEFAKLKGCLEELIGVGGRGSGVSKGKGQIISIIGVAGVGKSRLVSELKSYMQQNSALRPPPSALEGRCLSIGESVSYWVFIDILKSYFKFEATDDEKAMGEKITAAIKELLPNQADEVLPLFGNLLSIKFGNELDERLKSASPEQIKHQTFMALRDFFIALAQRQPVVLVFEDLHWSDNLSLDLISLLMEILTLAPLMLICVYRPEQEHKSWRISTIASSKCLERYTEIQLRELTPHESRRMVEEILRIENLPERVKELILQKSEGNPFFVEEVIRSLMESGIVYREGEIWKAKAEIESVTVPDTIQSVIMSRIDRLEEEVKYVLQCASVIGRLFRHRLLSYTSQRERELNNYLNQLEGRELIYEERAIPELEYSFKHVLTQETAYQSLLGRRRSEFHQKVGEGIEALYRDSIDEYYEQLAYHYDKSGVVEKAIEYLLKAGEKARSAYLNDEAIGYFKRALERLDGFGATHASPLQREWRLSALKGIGQIYLGIGKVAEAEEYLKQAIALGKEIGLPVRELVRLYHWLGDVLFWLNRWDEKIRMGEEGLALLGDNTESFEAALVNTQVAIGNWSKGNQKKWREFTLQNAQFIQRLPYSEELRPAYVHIVLMYARDYKDIEEAIKWLQALERVAQQHNDLRALSSMHSYMAVHILGPRGDLRKAISHHQRSLELNTKIGDDKHRSWDLIHAGDTFLLLGDLQKAEEYINKGLEILEAIGMKRDIAWSHVRIGTISLCQGDALSLSKGSWEKAVDAFQKAAQLYREIGAQGGETWAIRSLGRAYLAQSKRQEALRQFQEAIALAKTDSVNLAAALSGLEEAHENPEEFRAFCQRFREEHPEIGDLPFVQWYLEPTNVGALLAAPLNLFHDDFVRAQQAAPLHSSWTWHDPFEDCSFTVQNGLEIQAANGRDLWHINLSAPRILQPVSGDFAVQTVCVPVVRAGLKPAPTNKPCIGGILLWKDKENYLRLDKGTRGEREISFSGCIGNRDVIIGRGRLPSVGAGFKPALTSRIFLRLERIGSRVNALCSADGNNWFTVGHVEFPVDDPVEVGLHAIGNIDRTIYHGAFPEGTAIRFESFQLLGS